MEKCQSCPQPKPLMAHSAAFLPERVPDPTLPGFLGPRNALTAAQVQGCLLSRSHDCPGQSLTPGRLRKGGARAVLQQVMESTIGTGSEEAVGWFQLPAGRVASGPLVNPQ